MEKCAPATICLALKADLHGAGAAHDEAPAMDEDHDGEGADRRQVRAVHIQVQAVLLSHQPLS